MNAAQFVPALAAQLGIDPARLAVVDRALADAGMRRKSPSVRKPLQLTSTEGACLVIGAMTASSHPATRAAEIVRAWSALREIPDDPESEPGPRFIDALARLFDELASDVILATRIDLELSLTHRLAVIRIDDAVRIYGDEGSDYGSGAGRMHLVARVGRLALSWIAERCAG